MFIRDIRSLKTYLRNTKSEDRLNGLALRNIHQDIFTLHSEILRTLLVCSISMVQQHAMLFHRAFALFFESWYQLIPKSG
jgi:hypothetical protein